MNKQNQQKIGFCSKKFKKCQFWLACFLVNLFRYFAHVAKESKSRKVFISVQNRHRGFKGLRFLQGLKVLMIYDQETHCGTQASGSR